MAVMRSRRTPSPQRGEGWGEGVRKLRKQTQSSEHATSAARYLEECLPRLDYWDVPVERQDEDAANACVLEFLAKIGA
jgi:hypothetical protein